MLMPKGDFEISLNYAEDDREYPENNLNIIQLQNPLNDDLKTQIMSLDGVESIDEKHTVLAEAENVVLETQRTEVGGISENDLLSLNKSLKRGTLDYDELVHSNGIIFTWDILFEQYGFEIGDTIQLTLYDGNKKIPFTGTLMASTNSSDDTFLIADEVLQQLITETNPASAIYITVQPEKFESVKAQIDTLQQENTRFMFKSYDEELGIAKQLIRTIQYTIYGLLIVIGIIGYISLINTMITSILVRKKELGILQAIGLSDKQLRQMIHREGLFFTFGTLALSLTIGNGLGYLLVRIIINTQILTISQYEYPITQTLVLIVAVVIGQIAITVFVNRYIHKQSLVERMRDYDRRMYRYKAHYSLDCDNGIENAILMKPQTPEMLLEEKQLREKLYAAVMALPEKQAKRIYARYYLGMRVGEIAAAEGVDPSRVRDSIRRGLKQLAKYF